MMQGIGLWLLLRMRPQTTSVGLPACGRQWRQLAQVFMPCSPVVEPPRRGGGRGGGSGVDFRPLRVLVAVPSLGDASWKCTRQIETAPDQVHPVTVNILTPCKR